MARVREKSVSKIVFNLRDDRRESRPSDRGILWWSDMSMLTLQMPALPDPVRVILKPATTALLLFDVVEPICAKQPIGTEVMVPAIISLLARARNASVLVLYSTRAPNVSKWLPEVAPAPGEPMVESIGQDRFYNTDLDKMLKAKGMRRGEGKVGEIG